MNDMWAWFLGRWVLGNVWNQNTNQNSSQEYDVNQNASSQRDVMIEGPHAGCTFGTRCSPKKHKERRLTMHVCKYNLRPLQSRSRESILARNGFD